MKVAFYISGRAGRLMKYLKSTSPDSHESIKLVISDDVVDPNVRDCLKQSNISLVESPYNEIIGESNKERNGKLSDLILERLQSFGIDYCISFGSHILSGKLLDEYKYRLINFHPALLPMFPGRCAIDQAVAHGNTLLVGNTCHFIDSGVDTGPIIMQSVICLAAFEDAGRNYDVVLDLQIEMLKKLLGLLSDGRIEVKDGHVRISGADYNKSALFPNIPPLHTTKF